MPNQLFTGPASLRHPRERLAFVVTLLWSFPAALAIGFFLHQTIGISQVALFVVIAMVYITLARGRLIGAAVMIHEAQYPRVFAIVKRACAALDIPMPLVFVREDNFVPAVAMGFGEPYALVVSSHWIESFEDDELAFVIGRQLGHIAAGHTRYLSLLSINGNENALISLIFGPWLRSCELTCDKIGLLVCGSLDAATRAIAVSSFHHFGRHVNVEQFAEQGREIANDSVLRWGEWLGGEPYATRRIAEMRTFMASHSYHLAQEWFLREVPAEAPVLAPAGSLTVQRADCAGWWRRFTAVAIDLIVVSALVGAFGGQPAGSGQPSANNGVVVKNSTSSTVQNRTPNDTVAKIDGLCIGMTSISVCDPSQTLGRVGSYLQNDVVLWLMALYLFVLVGLAGQSFGMMIAGVRVVTTDFGKPGLGRSLLRYAIAFVLWPLILILSTFMHRVMLHDRWSGTRLVTSERAMARLLASAKAITAPA